MKTMRLATAVVVLLSLPGTSLAAEAQQAGKVYRIGFLTPVALPRYVEVFRQGLRERGYVEGTNILVEWRSTEGRSERYADFAAELIRLNVDVIVTAGNEAADAAKRATSTIPIVMAASSLPAEFGLVASLARPGGNVTGMSIDTGPEVAGKMLQLLKEAAPKVSRVGVILFKAVGTQRDTWVDPTGRLAEEIDEAAQRLRLSLQTVPAYEPVEFERAPSRLSATHDPRGS